MNPHLLSAEKVSFAYASGPVVRDCSLSIRAGEFVELAGPNGAGKSTLLGILAGLKRPSSGTVSLEGRPLDDWMLPDCARRMACLPQDPQVDAGFRVAEIVDMGRAPYRSWFGAERPGDAERVRECLAAVDLADLAERRIASLSGGEQRRVFLARALAQEPRILLLDEPTTHLDLRRAVEFVRLLDRLRRERGLAIVFVTHDLNLATPYADRIVLMSGGRIVADAPPREALVPDLLSRVYGLSVEVQEHGAERLPRVHPR